MVKGNIYQEYEFGVPDQGPCSSSDTSREI